MVRILRRESPQLFRSLFQERTMQRYLERLREHHKETYEHSLRVGLLSIDLGYENGLNGQDVINLGRGAMLHDMGKVRIPLEILAKRSGLDERERRIMEMHPAFGYEEIGLEYGFARNVAVAHHEFKSKPYPRQRTPTGKLLASADRRGAQEDVSVAAQMVAVADMYDALAQRRAYKEAMKLPQIEEVLRSQFTGEQRYVDQVLSRHSTN